MADRYAQAYQRVYLESASPTRVLDELYTRLLRDLDDGARCIAAGDIEGKAAATNHAVDIVLQLAAALDRSHAPALCDNLERLYDFVRSRVLDASVRLDARPLAEAAGVVRTIRDAFAEAAASSSR